MDKLPFKTLILPKHGKNYSACKACDFLVLLYLTSREKTIPEMSKKTKKTEQKKVQEPIADYGQPLNFEKVWLMFQETNKQFQELKEQSKETDQRMQETDRKMQETDRKIDKLARLYGNVSENSKDVAEEFFKRGLETKNEIFGIKYKQVDHLERITKKLKGEFDIVLHDSEYIIVIEVKYKLHPNDIEDFVTRKLPNFKKLFHEYAGKKVIGGVAGMSVSNDSSNLAQKHGLLVLTQAGENIALLNPDDFELKTY